MDDTAPVPVVPTAPTTPAPILEPTPAPTPAPPSPAPEPTSSSSTPATGTVTVSWDAPSLRVDDSALTNLAGYRVYYGSAPGTYTSKLEVNAPTLTSVVISSLPAGSYWFVVTAYDADGLESGYSESATTYVASN